VKLPEAIGFEQAAAMMLQGMTAQYLLRRTYPVKAGETILVHAAAGGVGLIMCQWAKHLGCTVIGTVSTEAKAELAALARRRPRHPHRRGSAGGGEAPHRRRDGAGRL
jgi:NADPH2:quinone reductase